MRKTVDEWRAFVAGLDDEALVENAENANTAAFVRAMMEEGYDAGEIDAVLQAFARRFTERGQLPPTGGYVDLAWLAQQR